jgi:hypothetical protein
MAPADRPFLGLDPVIQQATRCRRRLCLMPRDLTASVIVPSSRPDAARRAIESLRVGTTDGATCEIILVTAVPDRFGDVPGAVEIVAVETVHPPGRMRNIGARRARGPALLFLDDDCMASPQWVNRMLAALAGNPGAAAVGCRVVSEDLSFWPRCADYALFAPYQYRDPAARDLGSAALAVRREAFEAVGGFNERLQASEDWDLCLRLREAGWQCLFDPSVEVAHAHGRGSLSAIVQGAYRWGRRSGLMAQRGRKRQLSWLARLSVTLGHPFPYAFLIVPYAVAVTALQCRDLRGTDRRLPLFAPFILLARLAYHFGVWRRLLADR